MNTEYLVHHGILGQRWGIRRYQNPDGTLTAEGKKRQRISDKQYREKSLKKVEEFYNKNYRSGPYAIKKRTGINELREKIANEKNKEKLADYKLMLEYQKKLKSLEKEKVKKLTHDDILNEKRIVGKSYMKAVSSTVAASVALPGISWVIFTPTPQKDLSNNRIQESSREKILNDVKSKKNYKGNISTIKDIK